MGHGRTVIDPARHIQKSPGTRACYRYPMRIQLVLFLLPLLSWTSFACSPHGEIIIEPAPRRGSVSGEVRDEKGRPVSGVTLATFEQSTVSDASGRFRFEDIVLGSAIHATVRYDGQPEGVEHHIIAAVPRKTELLIRVPSDPNLTLPPTRVNKASVGGTVTPLAGGDPINTDTTDVMVFVEGGKVWGPDDEYSAAHYEVAVRWEGEPTVAADVVAYQGDRSGPLGIPSEITALAHQRIQMTEGDLSSVDLTLEPVSTVLRPIELGRAYKHIAVTGRSLRFAPGKGIPLSNVPAGQTFEMPVPSVAGAEFLTQIEITHLHGNTTVVSLSRSADGDWPTPLTLARPGSVSVTSFARATGPSSAWVLRGEKNGYDACVVSLRKDSGPSFDLVTDSLQSIWLPDLLPPSKTEWEPGEYSLSVSCVKPATVESLLAELYSSAPLPASTERWEETAPVREYVIE